MPYDFLGDRSDDPSGETSEATRTPFGGEAFSEFLNEGFLLAIDAERLLVGWGGLRAGDAPSDQACGLFTPNFFGTLGEANWLWTRHWDVVTRSHFSQLVFAGVEEIVKSKGERFQWLEPDLDGFSRQWQSLREGMRTRGLKKGVPVVFAKARGHFDLSSRARSLKGVASLPRQIYLYGFWKESYGLLGATPEILFSSAGEGIVETVALAGTRAKADDAANELMRDPKERYEHQLVVEDIQKQLSKFGDVIIGETGVVELPTLFHLKTRIQAKTAEALSFTDLARVLHPTPALGLSPRSLGFEEMRRWEDVKTDRARFGAPFGASWFENGRRHDHCLVAIRNVQWQGDEILLGSGCGVVGESVMEREWDELKLKRDSVKRMLDL